jgi:hypothetical protein
MGYGVAVGAQGYQIRPSIYLALVLGERLDVVDLGVAVRVVLAVGLGVLYTSHKCPYSHTYRRKISWMYKRIENYQSE